VQRKFVMADDAQQAEMKSGLIADPARDFDYVTMFTLPICKVNFQISMLRRSAGGQIRRVI
jgi:hypothetical protein